MGTRYLYQFRLLRLIYAKDLPELTRTSGPTNPVRRGADRAKTDKSSPSPHPFSPWSPIVGSRPEKCLTTYSIRLKHG